MLYTQCTLIYNVFSVYHQICLHIFYNFVYDFQFYFIGEIFYILKWIVTYRAIQREGGNGTILSPALLLEYFLGAPIKS
jgi:hypothetical protein